MTSVYPIPMRSPTSSMGPMSAKGCTRIASVAPVEMLLSVVLDQSAKRGEGDGDAPGEHGDDDEVRDGGGEGPGVGDCCCCYRCGDEDVERACQRTR